MLETNLNATCGEWSPNGQYFAVGGSPANRISTEKKPGDFDQVNIFSSYGTVCIIILILSCMHIAYTLRGLPGINC